MACNRVSRHQWIHATMDRLNDDGAALRFIQLHIFSHSCVGIEHKVTDQQAIEFPW